MLFNGAFDEPQACLVRAAEVGKDVFLVGACEDRVLTVRGKVSGFDSAEDHHPERAVTVRFGHIGDQAVHCQVAGTEKVLKIAAAVPVDANKVDPAGARKRETDPDVPALVGIVRYGAVIAYGIVLDHGRHAAAAGVIIVREVHETIAEAFGLDFKRRNWQADRNGENQTGQEGQDAGFHGVPPIRNWV